MLSGTASELERELPFWVFVDAIDDYLRSLEPRRFEALGDEARRSLAIVFPSLARFEVSGEALRHERYRSHHAARELLERLTATAPLVLALDDVHWADPASVELIGTLLRSPPDASVLIAVALRPRQAPGRLSAALEQAWRANTLTRLDLGALTPAEATQLLDPTIDEAVAEALYEDSGGNPFYLEQLARSLDRPATPETAAENGALAELGVPPLVAAALAQEILLLPDAARVVLQGAAVAGDPFDPELATIGALAPPAAALDTIDELLRLDLIRETDVPRRFRFRHPLVRRAVYDSASAGWRLGAHERCAYALASRGASAAERAHHVERAGRKGDAASVAVLRQAGEAAAPSARRRAPPTGSRKHSDSSPTMPPRRSASNSCSRAPARSRQPGTSRKGTRQSSRASSSSPKMRSSLRSPTHHCLRRHRTLARPPQRRTRPACPRAGEPRRP